MGKQRPKSSGQIRSEKIAKEDRKLLDIVFEYMTRSRRRLQKDMHVLCEFGDLGATFVMMWEHMANLEFGQAASLRRKKRHGKRAWLLVLELKHRPGMRDLFNEIYCTGKTGPMSKETIKAVLDMFNDKEDLFNMFHEYRNFNEKELTMAIHLSKEAGYTNISKLLSVKLVKHLPTTTNFRPEDVCPACLTKLSDCKSVVKSDACQHVMCMSCAENWVACNRNGLGLEKTTCPTCRANMWDPWRTRSAL